jgi:hypothetical protein
MKKLVLLSAAGALIAGYGSVQAQSLPQSGSSDLWLFVADPGTGTTFAEDTGISINSLLPSGSLVSNAVLNQSISDTINLLPTTALATYIATNGASNLEWGIEAAQYTTTGSGSISHPNLAGSVKGLTDNPSSQENNTSNLISSSLQTWVAAFNSDLNNFIVPGATPQAGYVAGGQTYKWSYGSVGGNVWGAGGTTANGGSTNCYQQCPDQSGIGLDTSAVLYGLTGNGNTGQLQSYILGNLVLTSAGTLETLGSSPVPLPAAVWLFGSGLLGLAGVGRRRAAAAAAA